MAKLLFPDAITGREDGEADFIAARMGWLSIFQDTRLVRASYGG
jgi:hypothetical protein